MSFSTWYHKDYLKEEGEVDSQFDPEVPQREMPADKVSPQQNVSGSFKQYMSTDNLTKGLVKLGQDVGTSIYNYAVKEFVNDDTFESEDDKIKYELAIRNKIAEDYNKKLIEVLKNAGIFIENTRRTIAKV